MKIKKLLLPLFVITVLSSCSKSNYNCVCVDNAIGYSTQIDTIVIKDTKAGAVKDCKVRNYASQLGDVNITCSIK